MFSYEVEKLQTLLAAHIREHLDTDAWHWLTEKIQLIRTEEKTAALTLTFAAITRKTGKQTIRLTASQLEAIQSIRPGLVIQDWPLDRLCRVWLLTHLPATGKEACQFSIEQLFKSAEMNELVALYSALPVLAFPAVWVARCTEGIRSNIGIVLEAILCNNPYPSENLGTKAWNQLVLKAFFTEKPIHRIAGIDERANPELAIMLTDYAHERWAAQRPVHPQLWRCVGKFINETNWPDIERIAHSTNIFEQQAAALACADSEYAPAKKLLQNNETLKAFVESHTLTWNKLGERMERWEEVV